LEGTAAQHNDNLLCLDELGQAQSRVVGEVAYMLANGSGKARALRDGSVRNRQEWRVSFLSSGEVTLDDKISDGGMGRTTAGQLVRIIDIPADAGHNMGIYDRKTDFPGGAELSNHLNSATAQYYGMPIRRFLDVLTKNKDQSLNFIIDIIKQTVDSKCVGGVSGQVERVCRRFGLIAAAGEWAVKHEILPFPSGSISSIAEKAFDSWLQSRGGSGNAEIENAISNLRDFIEKYGETRFVTIYSDEAIDLSLKFPHDFVGYKWKVDNTWIYLILSSYFKELWCRNISVSYLKSELVKRGYAAMNDNGNPMETKYIPGHGNIRGCILNSSLLEK
jgi:uncharacterized protein (DUF927 family)